MAGFPGYRVGSDGSVWSCRITSSPLAHSWKQKKLKRVNGYLLVGLHRDGKRHEFLVHRLILETFIGPCPAGMETCHGDGNRANNAILNLRWGNLLENADDKKKHGTMAAGSKNGRAKLDESDVAAIRSLLAGGEQHGAVASLYKVGKSTIGDIASGKTWSS